MQTDPIAMPWGTRLCSLSFGLLFVIATAVGCDGCGTAVNPPDAGEPEVEPGEPCRFNSDCEGGYCGDEGFCIAGLPPGTCFTDDDCEGEEICLIPDGSDVGACVNPHACDVDEDCPNPDQVCIDGDNDGFRDCIFAGCEDDAECEVELEGTCGNNEAAKCIARACVCRDLCGAPCGEGRQCCALPAGDSPTCIDDPGPCAALVCDPGFAGTTANAGDWSAPACGYPDAACTCEELPPLPAGVAGAPNRLLESPSGVRYVVAYNQTYGDVVVGAATGAVVTDWVHADGVPSGAPIEGGISGPRGGVAEPGDDVGSALDAAFASNGALHIVARNATNGNLRLISGPPEGPFSTKNLVTDADAGFTPRIFIDSAGRIAVAHVERRDPSGANSRLRVLVADAADAAAEDFAVYTVRTTALASVPCEGGCVEGEICPVVPEGETPECLAEAENCAPACGDGEVCTTSGCVERGVAPAGNVGLTVDTMAMADASIGGGNSGVVIFGHDPREGTLLSFRSTGDLFGGGATFATQTEAAEAGLNMGNRPSISRTSSGYLVASSETVDRGVFIRAFNDTLVEQGSAVAMDDGERVHSSGAIDQHAVDLVSISTGLDGAGVIAWQDGTDGSVRGRLRAASGETGPMQVLAGGPLSPTYAGNYGFSISTLSGSEPAVAAERLWLGGDPEVTEVVILNDFLSCPGNDDPFEPNDSEVDALALPDGNVVGGIACAEDDWFTFEADAGCEAVVTLVFNHEDGDLDLQVNAPDESSAGNSNGTNDAEEVSFTVAQSGVHKVRVQSFNGATNAYVLRADLDCD